MSTPPLVTAAPDCASRGSLGAELSGREAFRDYVTSTRGALAGYRCEILDCVSEGDQAFAKMRFSGRQVGALRGRAATGKAVSWLAAALFRIRGAQIASVWVLGDLVALDAQLQE